MNELIPAYAADKIKQGVMLVDARLLHDKLEVETPFHKWIDRRIEEYGFEEGVEFWTNLSKTPEGSKGGRPTTEYHLTLSMAKELAMVERTEVGRKVRRYFIEMEQQARTLLEERANQVQPIEQVKKRLRDTPSFKYMLIMQEQSRKIAKQLSKETDYGVRYNLHCQLRQVNECLGMPTLSLAELAADRPAQIE